MIPAFDESGVTLYQGHVIDVLKSLPEESVNCCITSPPYWGLRDYGTAEWDGGSAECDHKQESPRFNGPKQTTAQVSGHASQAEANNRKKCPKCGATRIDQQIGLEPTPGEYVDKMVEVFREDNFTTGNKWMGARIDTNSRNSD